MSCNNSQNKEIAIVTDPGKDPGISKPENFFPVTAYIKGQIFEIKRRGINPLKIIEQGNRTDSLWLPIETLNKEMADFLEPVIDTVNLMALFSETKFLDQTLNAYTFTYDPKKELPDSMPLKHWDVYVDPGKNTIQRIYMVKKAGNKTLQLTWLNDISCRIITIGEDNKGNDAVEKEVLIKWDF